jgi:O-antigen ligase
MKKHLTHGLLMAFGAFLFIRLALDATSRRMRILWAALAAGAVANCTLVVQGATGYLVLGTLALYLGFLAKGWRGIAFAAAAGVIAVAALMSVPGVFQARVLRIESEFRQWQPGAPDAGSSAGQRIEFYRVSLQIVKDRPLLGHGTGSFSSAYAEKLKGQHTILTRNPHDEYLNLMVQLGVVGLAALLYLFWTHWQCAARLATPLEHHVARALLLAMVVGCLFNSWLMDHTEGLLYVWLTGLLFAGLKSPGPVTRRLSPVTDSA